jgi:hypothetical protein
MLRFLFRVLGLLLLACAFAALIVDGTRSIAADAITLTPLGQAATQFFPQKFALFQAAVQRVSPFLWDPVAVVVLLLPAWFVAGGLGGLIMLATRRRRPLIGHSSR